jgi:hypothetical protein
MNDIRIPYRVNPGHFNNSRSLYERVIADCHEEGADGSGFVRGVWIRPLGGVWEKIGRSRTERGAWEIALADPRVGADILILPVEIMPDGAEEPPKPEPQPRRKPGVRSRVFPWNPTLREKVPEPEPTEPQAIYCLKCCQPAEVNEKGLCDGCVYGPERRMIR